MPRRLILLAAVAVTAGALGFAATHVRGASATSSDLAAALASARNGPQATGSGIDTVAEFNVDDGQVGDVQEGQTGEHEDAQSDTATSQSGATGPDAAGQAGDQAGNSDS